MLRCTLNTAPRAKSLCASTAAMLPQLTFAKTCAFFGSEKHGEGARPTVRYSTELTSSTPLNIAVNLQPRIATHCLRAKAVATLQEPETTLVALRSGSVFLRCCGNSAAPSRYEFDVQEGDVVALLSHIAESQVDTTIDSLVAGMFRGEKVAELAECVGSLAPKQSVTLSTVCKDC